MYDVCTLNVCTLNTSGRFKKYRKMLRFLSEDAVRNTMKIDGFSEPQIDAFIARRTEKLEEVANEVGRPESISRRFCSGDGMQKYRKMLSMLTEEEPVRIKMRVDGFSEEEIEGLIADHHSKETAPIIGLSEKTSGGF